MVTIADHNLTVNKLKAELSTAKTKVRSLRKKNKQLRETVETLTELMSHCERCSELVDTALKECKKVYGG